MCRSLDAFLMVPNAELGGVDVISLGCGQDAIEAYGVL